MRRRSIGWLELGGQVGKEVCRYVYVGEGEGAIGILVCGNLKSDEEREELLTCSSFYLRRTQAINSYSSWPTYAPR